MRAIGLAFLLMFFSATTWAASMIVEITPENIESLPFEFKFTTQDRLLYTVITIEVRPRTANLSEIRDQIGGRRDHCQETRGNYSLNETPMKSQERDGALIYKFRVVKGVTRKCFYFWQKCSTWIPCSDVFWISLDEQWVR